MGWRAQPGPQLDAIRKHWIGELFYGGAVGGGKDLSLDTPLPTPSGWTTMGDILPGDWLLDERGKPCRVVAKSEIFRNEALKVRFSDGSEIVAGPGHQWVTSSGIERSRMLKQSDEFRARRRESRPSRVSGRKSRAFTDSLVARNSAGASIKPLPLQGVRTTREIAETLRFGRGLNHSVRVQSALDLPHVDLPIDPYLLGAWIGDGNSRAARLTIAEPEMAAAVGDCLPANWALVKGITKYDYGVPGGMLGRLRALGVLSNKHIPTLYLRSSREQRIALLQGLMDTDGYCDTRGQCEFTQVNRRVADDVAELLSSLGIKCVVTEGDATLNGKVVSRKYRIKFLTDTPAFRLPRKLLRQKRGGFRGTHMWRYIESVDPVGVVPTQCVQVDSPSHMYLCGRQMIPTHNSDYLLGDFAQDVPGEWGDKWHGILFRRTYPELEQLIGRSQELYPAWFPKVQWSESKTTWTWPNGAELKMRYLESATDWMRYWGHEYTWIGWDELPSWPNMTAYKKMKARLRSPARVPNKRIRATGNPGGPAHHEVKAYWRIDLHPLGNHYWHEGGMTRMFIRSRLQDNTILMRNDPLYADRLSGLGSPDLVRAWLEGDWSVVAGAFFSEFLIDRHVVAPRELPKHWLRFVTADWGSARPFAVYWCAVSDGELQEFPRGSIVVYREWYGMHEGQPNTGLKMTAEEWGAGIKSRTGAEERIDYWVVDPAALAQNGGPSIAERSGILWMPGDNRRVGKLGAMGGWDQVRARLVGEDDRPMLYLFSVCKDLIRTLPALQHDTLKPEDVATDGEDHAADAIRYGMMSRPYIKDNPAPEPVKFKIHRTIAEMVESRKRARMNE